MRAHEDKREKGVVSLTIEITPDELKPYLAKAAHALSAAKPIPGFRPGAAPLDLALRTFGAHAVWQAATERAVPFFFGKAVDEAKIATIGSPRIDVLTLAPDNPFKFRASVALLPTVELGDFKKIKVKNTKTKVTDTEVTKVLGDLRKMQSKEVHVDEAVNDRNKVVIDMEMLLDSIPIEGGKTTDHSIYMNEEYYIPGLKEQIHGAKSGDTKNFSLAFPKEHYNKNLAGKKVDFAVTIKDVYRIDEVALDDAFAATLGQKSVEDLKGMIRKNLTDEAVKKDEQALELSILEHAIKASLFSDIPDILVNEEVRRIMQEFEARLDEQGGTLDDYLAHIKKTREKLMLEFAPQALERVKIGLLLRRIARDQALDATEKEISAQCELVAPGALARTDLESDRKQDLRQYARTIAINRKAIEYIKGQSTITPWRCIASFAY